MDANTPTPTDTPTDTADAGAKSAEPSATVSLALIDATFNYLSTRPWREVNGLIQGFQRELAGQAPNA